jgi:hypothetical protein
MLASKKPTIAKNFPGSYVNLDYLPEDKCLLAVFKKEGVTDDKPIQIHVPTEFQAPLNTPPLDMMLGMAIEGLAGLRYGCFQPFSQVSFRS